MKFTQIDFDIRPRTALFNFYLNGKRYVMTLAANVDVSAINLRL